MELPDVTNTASTSQSNVSVNSASDDTDNKVKTPSCLDADDIIIINDPLDIYFNQFSGAKSLDSLSENGANDYASILHSIRQIVSCTACFNAHRPMKECSNGHLICQSCYLTLRQVERSQCPSCRVTLHSEPKKALIAEKVMSELPDTCAMCCSVMPGKILSIHRIAECPKRKVSCRLGHLGCAWTGTADEMEQHDENCTISNGRNLDDIVAHVATKDQTWSEIYQSFLSVLKRLDATEPQFRTVALNCTKQTSNSVIFKSDQFHSNQSRWSLELKFVEEKPSKSSEQPSPTGIMFRVVKENSISTSRRHYGFTLLGLETENGVKMHIRPQMYFMRFQNRGQVSEYFSAIPVNGSLFCARENHILYAEIGVARKLIDDIDD